HHFAHSRDLSALSTIFSYYAHTQLMEQVLTPHISADPKKRLHSSVHNSIRRAFAALQTVITSLLFVRRSSKLTTSDSIARHSRNLIVTLTKWMCLPSSPSCVIRRSLAVIPPLSLLCAAPRLSILPMRTIISVHSNPNILSSIFRCTLRLCRQVGLSLLIEVRTLISLSNSVIMQHAATNVTLCLRYGLLCSWAGIDVGVATTAQFLSQNLKRIHSKNVCDFACFCVCLEQRGMSSALKISPSMLALLIRRLFDGNKTHQTHAHLGVASSVSSKWISACILIRRMLVEAGKKKVRNLGNKDVFGGLSTSDEDQQSTLEEDESTASAEFLKQPSEQDENESQEEILKYLAKRIRQRGFLSFIPSLFHPMNSLANLSMLHSSARAPLLASRKQEITRRRKALLQGKRVTSLIATPFPSFLSQNIDSLNDAYKAKTSFSELQIISIPLSSNPVVASMIPQSVIYDETSTSHPKILSSSKSLPRLPQLIVPDSLDCSSVFSSVHPILSEIRANTLCYLTLFQHVLKTSKHIKHIPLENFAELTVSAYLSLFSPANYKRRDTSFWFFGTSTNYTLNNYFFPAVCEKGYLSLIPPPFGLIKVSVAYALVVLAAIQNNRKRSKQLKAFLSVFTRTLSFIQAAYSPVGACVAISHIVSTLNECFWSLGKMFSECSEWYTCVSIASRAINSLDMKTLPDVVRFDVVPSLVLIMKVIRDNLHIRVTGGMDRLGMIGETLIESLLINGLFCDEHVFLLELTFIHFFKDPTFLLVEDKVSSLCGELLSYVKEKKGIIQNIQRLARRMRLFFSYGSSPCA
ncbi:hypothetical protein ADUPG1_011803, partial [Aduncisulcus paluster]